MPIYEYRCEACGEVVEAIQSFSAPPLTRHEDCGGELRKLISRSAFHLKGGGWYSDHYGLKPGGDSKKDSPVAGAKKEGSKESPAATPSKDGASNDSSAAKSDSKPSEPAKSDSKPAPTKSAAA